MTLASTMEARTSRVGSWDGKRVCTGLYQDTQNARLYAWGGVKIMLCIIVCIQSMKILLRFELLSLSFSITHVWFSLSLGLADGSLVPGTRDNSLYRRHAGSGSLFLQTVGLWQVLFRTSNPYTCLFELVRCLRCSLPAWGT
jgi:hypothetical protein